MLQTFLLMALIILMTGFILGMTPYVVRRNIHFGVMLPDQAHELSIAKKWKKQFLSWSIGATLGCILPLFIGFFLNLTADALNHYLAVVGTLAILVVIVWHGVMYLYFHRQVKVFKEREFSHEEVQHDARIMVSTEFHTQKMIVSNSWLILIGGAIVLVTALVPLVIYDQIPAYVPVNWDFDGVARFVPKTRMVFLLLPAIQLGMLFIFLFVNYSFKATKQLLNPRRAKSSVAQNRAYRYAMSKFLIITAIGSLLLMSLTQFMIAFDVHEPRWVTWISIGFMLCIFVGIVYLIWKYGQGGERYKRKQSSDDDSQAYRMLDDDKFWKLGVFYYNPNDSAIFVEKRFGIGITLNFARPQAWLMMLGVLVFTIATIIISYVMVGAL